MRLVITFFAAAIVAFAVYVAAGPFIAIYSINEGTVDEDPVLVAEYVDFPLLKKNIHVQIDPVMNSLKKTLGIGSKNDPIPTFFVTLFDNYVDGLVEGAISPENLGSVSMLNTKNPTKPFRHFRFKFDTLDQAAMFEKQPDGSEIRYTFSRYDLTWKLTNIDIARKLEEVLKPVRQIQELFQSPTKRSGDNPSAANISGRPAPKLSRPGGVSTDAIPPSPQPQSGVALLQDLLKDMQKKAPPPAPQAKSSSQTPTNNIAPNITDRASVTELDAIRRHIESCWRIDPGTEGMKTMPAEVKVMINPDGSVQRVDVVDMAHYSADLAFRTFADSARNAVLSCGNIPISPERYNLFKELTMTFSPQGRIN